MEMFRKSEDKEYSTTVIIESPKNPESPGVEKERILSYLNDLGEIMENKANYFDFGGAAKLFSIPETDLCIKAVKNRHRNKENSIYNLGATPKQEFGFLESLHGFEISGIRTPTPLMCIESGDSAVIIMERLDAINLQKVLNGESTLPEGFDFDSFYERLETYIRELHSKKKISHRDLFARNIMVENNGDSVYVIDFGRARKIEQDEDEGTEDDWQKFDEIFGQLEKYRQNKAVKKVTQTERQETYTFNEDLRVFYSEKLLGLARESIKLLETQDIAEIVLKEGKNMDIFLSKTPTNLKSLYSFRINDTEYYIGKRKR